MASEEPGLGVFPQADCSIVQHEFNKSNSQIPIPPHDPQLGKSHQLSNSLSARERERDAFWGNRVARIWTIDARPTRPLCEGVSCFCAIGINDPHPSRRHLYGSQGLHPRLLSVAHHRNRPLCHAHIRRSHLQPDEQEDDELYLAHISCMFISILSIIAFVIFGYVAVGGIDVGRVKVCEYNLEEYHGWLRNHMANRQHWARTSACLRASAMT